MLREYSPLALISCLLTGMVVLPLGWFFFNAPDVSQVDFGLENQPNLLIVAPHQDDAVIMAGQLAQQVLSAGGAVSVVYVTRPNDPSYSLVRANEAREAWTQVCENCADLIFLGLPEGSFVDCCWDTAMSALKNLIEKVDPTVVVFPLLEYGNRDHDAVSELVRLIRVNDDSRVWLPASLYNPLLVPELNPTSFTRFLIRLLPGVKYINPPPGFSLATQFNLVQKEDDVLTKRQMLLAFTSQSSIIPLSQFGFPDLFESMETAPSTCCVVLGKRMSATAVVILAALSALLMLAGWKIFDTALDAGHHEWIHGCLGFLVSVLIIVAYARPNLLKEDLIYVVIATAGGAVRVVVPWAQSTLRRKSETKH